MTQESITNAVVEAQKFMKAAGEVLRDREMGTKASARLRRQSMELSRSLSEMRRP